MVAQISFKLIFSRGKTLQHYTGFNKNVHIYKRSTKTCSLISSGL